MDLYDLALAIYEVSQQRFQHYDSIHRRQHSLLAMMQVMVNKLMPAVNFKMYLEREMEQLVKENDERHDLEVRMHERFNLVAAPPPADRDPRDVADEGLWNIFKEARNILRREGSEEIPIETDNDEEEEDQQDVRPASPMDEVIDLTTAPETSAEVQDMPVGPIVVPSTSADVSELPAGIPGNTPAPRTSPHPVLLDQSRPIEPVAAGHSAVPASTPTFIRPPGQASQQNPKTLDVAVITAQIDNPHPAQETSTIPDPPAAATADPTIMPMHDAATPVVNIIAATPQGSQETMTAAAGNLLERPKEDVGQRQRRSRSRSPLPASPIVTRSRARSTTPAFALPIPNPAPAGRKTSGTKRKSPAGDGEGSSRKKLKEGPP